MVQACQNRLTYDRDGGSAQDGRITNSYLAGIECTFAQILRPKPEEISTLFELVNVHNFVDKTCATFVNKTSTTLGPRSVTIFVDKTL